MTFSPILMLLQHVKKGRPSAGGSHMSGVWGREKSRQASPAKSAERLLRTHDLVTQ